MLEDKHLQEKRSLIKKIKELKNDMRSLKVSVAYLHPNQQDHVNENCQPVHYFLDKF
jgi:hypothetical protein